MTIFKNLNNNIAAINNACKKKNTYCKLKFSKNSLEMINLLYTYGFLKGFFICKKRTYIYTFPKYYKGFSVIRRIFSISSSGKKYINRLNRVSKIKNGDYYVISYSGGLKIINDLYKPTNTGLVLFKIEMNNFV